MVVTPQMVEAASEAMYGPGWKFGMTLADVRWHMARMEQALEAAAAVADQPA